MRFAEPAKSLLIGLYTGPPVVCAFVAFLTVFLLSLSRLLNENPDGFAVAVKRPVVGSRFGGIFFLLYTLFYSAQNF